MRMMSVVLFLAVSLFSNSIFANEVESSKPEASIADVIDSSLAKPTSYCSVTIYCPEGAKQCEATGDRTHCSKGRNWIQCIGEGRGGQHAHVSYVCQGR